MRWAGCRDDTWSYIDQYFRWGIKEWALVKKREKNQKRHPTYTSLMIYWGTNPLIDMMVDAS